MMHLYMLIGIDSDRVITNCFCVPASLIALARNNRVLEWDLMPGMCDAGRQPQRADSSMQRMFAPEQAAFRPDW
jgi:hypothetical protein